MEFLFFFQECICFTTTVCEAKSMISLFFTLLLNDFFPPLIFSLVMKVNGLYIKSSTM